jgi:hypothetical protein
MNKRPAVPAAGRALNSPEVIEGVPPAFDTASVMPNPETVVGLLVMLDQAGVTVTAEAAVSLPLESTVNVGVCVALP